MTYLVKGCKKDLADGIGMAEADLVMTDPYEMTLHKSQINQTNGKIGTQYDGSWVGTRGIFDTRTILAVEIDFPPVDITLNDTPDFPQDRKRAEERAGNITNS